jgi:hypothetical protein
MKKLLLTTVGLVALTGAAHANETSDDLAAFTSPNAVIKAVTDTASQPDSPPDGTGVSVKHTHEEGKGFTADVTINTLGGAHDITDYAYVIHPDHAPAYYTFCEDGHSDGRTSVRACWTSLGAVRLDRDNGHGDWVTVRKLREHF